MEVTSRTKINLENIVKYSWRKYKIISNIVLQSLLQEWTTGGAGDQGIMKG